MRTAEQAKAQVLAVRTLNAAHPGGPDQSAGICGGTVQVPGLVPTERMIERILQRRPYASIYGEAET